MKIQFLNAIIVLDEIKNILLRSITIKLGTFNNKTPSYYFGPRLPKNGLIIVQNWSRYVCLFSISIQIIFFWQLVKQQTVKTCKLGYNWIFLPNILKMDKQRYLKGPKMVQYGLKVPLFEFLNIHLFSPYNMPNSTENERKQSDLSLVIKKIWLVAN